MRNVRFPMLALAALAAAATAAGGQALYSPLEGDFSVAFPDMPQVQSRPANRSKDIAARRYVDQQPSRVMTVLIEDYPDGALPAAPNAGVYDHMMRARADDHDEQLISTRAARLAGKPCLEGQFTDKTGDVEIVRVLMVGDRLYQLSYALPEGAEANGADAAFFNSFRITPKP